MSHLPAGAVLELSSPSVPGELVERVVSGDVPALGVGNPGRAEDRDES